MELRTPDTSESFRSKRGIFISQFCSFVGRLHPVSYHTAFGKVENMVGRGQHKSKLPHNLDLTYGLPESQDAHTQLPQQYIDRAPLGVYMVDTSSLHWIRCRPLQRIFDIIRSFPHRQKDYVTGRAVSVVVCTLRMPHFLSPLTSDINRIYI